MERSKKIDKTNLRQSFPNNKFELIPVFGGPHHGELWLYDTELEICSDGQTKNGYFVDALFENKSHFWRELGKDLPDDFCKITIFILNNKLLRAFYAI